MSGEVSFVHEFPTTVGVSAKETSTFMVRKHVCPQVTFECEGSVTFGTLIARFIPSKYSLRMGFVPVDLTKVSPLTELAYKVKNLIKLIFCRIYGLIYAKIILDMSLYPDCLCHTVILMISSFFQVALTSELTVTGKFTCHFIVADVIPALTIDTTTKCQKFLRYKKV